MGYPPLSPSYYRFGFIRDKTKNASSGAQKPLGGFIPEPSENPI
jgi:hypothetical protein